METCRLQLKSEFLKTFGLENPPLLSWAPLVLNWTASAPSPGAGQKRESCR